MMEQQIMSWWCSSTTKTSNLNYPLKSGAATQVQYYTKFQLLLGESLVLLVEISNFVVFKRACQLIRWRSSKLFWAYQWLKHFRTYSWIKILNKADKKSSLPPTPTVTSRSLNFRIVCPLCKMYKCPIIILFKLFWRKRQHTQHQIHTQKLKINNIITLLRRCLQTAYFFLCSIFWTLTSL